MITHRLSSYLVPSPAAAAPQPAFVPCPLVFVASPAQQTWVQELYRVALERARLLHRPSRWEPLYRASAN
jgi:hypothetical protein